MATKLPEVNNPLTRKDQFGFGTEQPISQEDLLKMERSKLDKLLSMGKITQEEFTRMYKQLQDSISRMEKEDTYTHKDLARDIANEVQDPRLWSNIKGILSGKSREERIADHKNLDQSKFRTVYGDEGYQP